MHAHEIIEAGRAEHAQLVSSTGIHQAATQAADELREQTRRECEAAVAEAQAHAQQVRAEAEAYAAKLTADAEDYADRTLAELAETLHRSAATAEQGRVALARRRAPADGDGIEPADSAADPVNDGDSD